MTSGSARRPAVTEALGKHVIHPGGKLSTGHFAPDPRVLEVGRGAGVAVSGVEPDRGVDLVGRAEGIES